jgi:hypothetical protein
MLTVEKLRIYEAFDGDVDGWARSSAGKDASRMADGDWLLIDELLTGLATVEAGLASAAFSRQLESRLLACTADEPARIALRALAARRGPSDAA